LGRKDYSAFKSPMAGKLWGLQTRLILESSALDPERALFLYKPWKLTLQPLVDQKGKNL
jgi:hypothetical protein